MPVLLLVLLHQLLVLQATAARTAGQHTAHQDWHAACSEGECMNATWPVTLVTGLWDIGRGGHGRSIDQYKEWMAQTLRIRNPFVVHVSSEELKKWVLDQRQGLPTRVIVHGIDQLPYYFYRYYVEHIVTTEKFRKKMNSAALGALEFNLPTYIPTIFSKFSVMDRVAHTNPFNSRYFFWVDAGSGRWAQAAVNRIWPNITKLYDIVPQLKDGTPTFILQRTARMPSKEEFNETRELTTLSNYLAATVMGGDAAALRAVRIRAHNFLLDMAQQGVANNEQCFLLIDSFRHPDMYHIMPSECPPQGCAPTFGSDRNFITMFDWLSP